MRCPVGRVGVRLQLMRCSQLSVPRIWRAWAGIKRVLAEDWSLHPMPRRVLAWGAEKSVPNLRDSRLKDMRDDRFL